MKPDIQEKMKLYQRIEIYRTKQKLIWYILGYVAFVLIGVMMLFQSNQILSQIMGVIVILFFGGTMYFWICEWMRTSPILVIDQHGVIDDGSTVMSASRLIQWHEIQSISTVKVTNQTQIHIKLHDETTYLNQLSGLAKNLMAFNRKMGYDGVYLNVHASQYSAEEVAEILEQYRQHLSQ